MSKIIVAETTAKVETQPRGKMIAYWSVTLLLAASVMLSGIGQLMQYGGNIELVTILGYPLYVLTILGIWKVLGAIARVVPGFPRLKESLDFQYTTSIEKLWSALTDSSKLAKWVVNIHLKTFHLK
ncbi:hypothetical protein QF028_002827 [Neobacillus sp. B4I6]|jgi:hypothetical protein|uniref:DoxX family protein n=1 Tax=Neobacillus sp. B4I6 TaxID=3373925 RepID=UPI003D1A2F7F